MALIMKRHIGSMGNFVGLIDEKAHIRIHNFLRLY
jgi:hypothetical protein